MHIHILKFVLQEFIVVCKSVHVTVFTCYYWCTGVDTDNIGTRGNFSYTEELLQNLREDFIWQMQLVWLDFWLKEART